MMTTLQIVLALVAVVLIGAIVVYNLVQERRFRKEAERMFAHRRDDIMLGESVRAAGAEADAQPRIAFGDDSVTAPEVLHALREAEAEQDAVDLSRHLARPSAAEAAPAAIPAPTAAPVSAAPTAPKPPAPRPLPAKPPAPVAAPVASAPPPPPAAEAEAAAVPNALDPETEYIARIRFASPCTTHFGALLGTLRRIGKPVRAFGKRTDGLWETLADQPRSGLQQVAIGLQLADRGGAVSHEQLDTFCRALYGFAAEAGGAVICPDKQDALQAAKALDLLCMEVDVQIGLNVVASDARPFTSEAIHKQAEDARLVLSSEGVYQARDAFGQVLFSLVNQDEQPFPADGRGMTVHGVTLLFDVPRVADGLAVFDRMTRLGFDLAWRLEGRLVDDSGRAVNEDNLNRDRARLAAYYGRMEARGIPAGGERALRLFV